MATRTTKVQSTMAVKYKTGVDAKGNDILKSQRFSKVKTTAVDSDIFEVGAALGTVLKYPLVEISRDDLNVIVNE